jgi:hypothetical protein
VAVVQPFPRRWTASELLVAGAIDAAELQQMVLFLGFCVMCLGKFKLVGGLEHDFYFSISYMGCHPKAIDELHDFSGWLLHHQPVVVISL